MVGKEVGDPGKPSKGGVVDEVSSSLSPEFIYGQFAEAWTSTRSFEEAGKKRPRLTKDLLDWFRKEGRARGYQVYPDRVEMAKEYLNDLCWCVEADGTPQTGSWTYRGIALALESELERAWDEILYDFHKLLDVKAPLKILICAPNRHQLEILSARISSQIKEHMFGTPSEHYLVIALGPKVVNGWSFDHTGANSTSEPPPNERSSPGIFDYPTWQMQGAGVPG